MIITKNTPNLALPNGTCTISLQQDTVARKTTLYFWPALSSFEINVHIIHAVHN